MYYFNENVECDFVVIDYHGKIQLTQVCWELTATSKEREIKGLTAAMEFF